MPGFWQDFQRILKQPGEGLLKIIAVNSLLFLTLMLLRIFMIFTGKEAIYESLLEQLTLSSDIRSNFLHPWSFISYFFIHVEIFHLVFNMMFLYWFGKILQEVIGNNKSVQIYFLGGIMGAIAFLMAYHFIPFFEHQQGSFLLGASGGVFAIVLAAATLRPNFEVQLFLIGPVRIKFIAGARSGRSSIVKGFVPTRQQYFEASPHGTFTGGINVAMGDVNGDGYSDVIIGASKSTSIV